MTTNEEIIKKYGVDKNEPMLKDMLNEARADTAKEIFNKLDKKELWVFDTIYYPMQPALVISRIQYNVFKKTLEKKHW